MWHRANIALSSALALLLVLAASVSARGAEYPERPLTLIVPFSAGGSSDVIARLIAEKMSEDLGRSIVTENIGGAGGAIALARAAAAAPDGYTFVIGNAGTNAASYAINPNLKYTPASFATVGMVAKTAAILAVKKAHPAQTLQDLVAYARANPRTVTLGHAGVGSSNYLACKIFLQAAQIEATLVSYRGAAPALNDLIGGQIDGVCDNAASVSPAIEGGLVRGLAVAGTSRLPNLPNLPTAIEGGVPGFVALGWNALFVPAGTSEAVIARLNAAARKAVAAPDLQKRFGELGAAVATGEELEAAHTASFVAAEVEKYRVLLANAKDK